MATGKLNNPPGTWLFWTGHCEQSHPEWGIQLQKFSTLDLLVLRLASQPVFWLNPEREQYKAAQTQPHIHPIGSMDGMGPLSLAACLETSNMKPIFTKYWIAVLWASARYERCQIPHPLIKPLKRWTVIQLTVILGKSWCSQKQQRTQKTCLRILH